MKLPAPGCLQNSSLAASARPAPTHAVLAGPANGLVNDFRRLFESTSTGAASDSGWVSGTRPQGHGAQSDPPERSASPEGSSQRRSDPESLPGGAAAAAERAGVVAPAVPLSEPCHPLGSAPPVCLDAVVQEIVRAVSVHQVSGQSTVRMQVSAPQISRLDLDLRVQGGRVQVNMVLADPAEYRLVRAALPELEASLREKSMNAAPIQVQFRPGTQSGDSHPERPPVHCPNEQGGAGSGIRREPHPSRPVFTRRTSSGTDYVI